MKYNEMIKEKEGVALEVDPETLDMYAKHNQAFLTVCNKNTLSEKWYKHYTNCCRTLEICIIEKTIKDIWAQGFYFELEKAVKVFNRIAENRYIYLNNLKPIADCLLQDFMKQIDILKIRLFNNKKSQIHYLFFK